MIIWTDSASPIGCAYNYFFIINYIILLFKLRVNFIFIYMYIRDYISYCIQIYICLFLLNSCTFLVLVFRITKDFTSVLVIYCYMLTFFALDKVDCRVLCKVSQFAKLHLKFKEWLQLHPDKTPRVMWTSKRQPLKSEVTLRDFYDGNGRCDQIGI